MRIVFRSFYLRRMIASVFAQQAGGAALRDLLRPETNAERQARLEQDLLSRMPHTHALRISQVFTTWVSAT